MLNGTPKSANTLTGAELVWIMLLLRECKLAEYLKDSDLSTLAKTCLYAYIILLVVPNVLFGILTFPTNIILIAFLLSLLPIILKYKDNFSSFFKTSVYLLFPITLKAWVIGFVLHALSIAFIIFTLTFYNTSGSESMLNETLGFEIAEPKEPTGLESLANSIKNKNPEEITQITLPIILTVALIFTRWRYAKSIKIWGAKNV